MRQPSYAPLGKFHETLHTLHCIALVLSFAEQSHHHRISKTQHGAVNVKEILISSTCTIGTNAIMDHQSEHSEM